MAVVSGGGGSWIEAAAGQGVDVFLTGETSLAAHNAAEDCGINVVFGGHYATESLGVKAVGKRLRKKFGVTSEFIDLKVRY